MKSATAYFRNGQVFLHPNSRTTAGFEIFSPPVLAAHPTYPAEIGQKALLALNEAKDGIPVPRSYDALMDPLYQVAGVKSWQSFVKGSRLVLIDLQDEQITLTPSKNAGAKDGFHHLNELKLVASSEPDNLGNAILEALSRCE